MRFLRAVGGDVVPMLQGERVYLRPPVMSDHEAWVRIRAISRDFLRPWEPLWPADDLERAAFRRRLRRYARQMREGTAYPFFVFSAADHTLLGGLTLAQVRRGVTQTGTIGYWMGKPHAGRGLMTDAVATLVRWALGPLKLHRVEAACLPENAASIRLLEKVGFTREGLARGYLEIAGEWRDHLLWGLVAGDPVLPGGNRRRTGEFQPERLVDPWVTR